MPNQPKPEVSLPLIEAELQQLAGTIPIKVKLAKKGESLHTIENDNLTTFIINPGKIKTQKQLDDLLIDCRKTLMIGGN